MSQVVRAFDRARGEDVALKILSTERTDVTLSGEFRYIASLMHPGVVSVYDFGLSADGRAYFTMELLEEGDLLDVAERASLDTMLRTAREIFRTLDFIHARGVVHADLKPSNIRLGKTQDEHYPKLLDFGISWESPEQQTGGTVVFMAPELFTRTRDRDHRSDLYSMGVVLFEMLTGDLPFVDNSVVRLAQHHVSTPPPDPRDIWPQMPGALAELILRLLEKQPADRFQTGGEVVAAIDAYLAAQAPPRAKRPGAYVIADPEIRYAGASRYIGHGAELERVLARTSASAQEGGSLFVITGEEGAGKTRLLNELRVAIQLRGVGFLTVDLEGSIDGAEVVERLRSAVASASSEDLVPTAEGADRVILEAEQLANAALQQARSRPLVCAIEGLASLSDEATRPLRAFVKAVLEGPVSVVATSRTKEGAAHEVAAIDAAERVHLRRVSREACAEILRSLVGEMDGAQAIVDHVYGESGGNPGAIEAVVHALVAEGAIVQRNQSWEVAPELGGELPRLSAESGLQAVAAAQLDGLTEMQRDVALAAATLGDPFSADLLAEVVDEPNVQEVLNELVGRQVIEPSSEVAGSWRRYGFRLRPARDVLLERGEAERLDYSRRIVDVLQARGEKADADVLGHHLLLLGEAAGALRVVSGALERGQTPTRELVRVLRHALEKTHDEDVDEELWCELATELAGIDRRHGRTEQAVEGYRAVIRRATSGAKRLAAAARRELGDLLMLQGDPAGEEELLEALASARELGDDNLVGLATYALGNRLTFAGRHDEAGGYLSEALSVAEARQDRELRAMAFKLRSTLHWFRGRFAEAERDARSAVRDYASLESHHGLAVANGALANTLFSRGEIEAATSAYREALDAAHEAGWLTGVGKLEASLAAAEYHADRWDAACEHFEAAIAILERTGNHADQLIPMYSLGFVTAQRGENSTARQHCLRALELARRVGYRKGEADALLNLGETSLQAGALDEASSQLTEGVEIARAIGSTDSEIEGERRLLEVDLARHAGPLDLADRAKALLRRAEETSLRTEVRHIQRVAGVALARGRDAEEAKVLLEMAQEGFEELGSRYEAARTVRIMSELEAQGLIIGEDMEGKLRSACRVFRRLRAQPELDAARRIRDRLGIPPSSVSMLADGSETPRASSLSTPPSPASVAPDAWTREDAVEPEPVSTHRAAKVKRSSHDMVTEDVIPLSEPLYEEVPLSDRTPLSPGMPVSERMPLSSQEAKELAQAPTRHSVPSLIDVSRQLSEILELEELLACIIDAAIDSSDAQRGFVIACDRAGHPTLRVSRGLGGLDLDDDLELSRSAVGRVIATRTRVEWRADMPGKPDALGQSVMLLGLQAIVALPLINRGKLWGVLYLDTRLPKSELTGSAMAPLEALAAHAAVAIQNAWLFEELGRKNELIASAINELRHPLDALQRCAEIAYQQSEGTATHRLNNTVRGHARRLSVMVARVLELATTEPAKVGASKVSVQVRDLADAALLQLRPLDDIDQTPLELEVPWGLPTILGHRDQLIQVIASMLAAALRASVPDEAVTLTASAEEAPVDESADPFFPPSALELSEGVVIRVRFRPASAEDRVPLDELGLAIAREIVEHHGGVWRAQDDEDHRVLEVILPSLVLDLEDAPVSSSA